MRHITLLLLTMLLFWGCAKAPVTNRSQLILLSNDEETALGLSESQKILQSSKISTNKRETARIRQIGQRIAAVSGRDDFEWEFHLIDEKVLNAFCLPGGKVFFYQGIVDLAENDDQIATVMGHEVAHALARHGAERMSHQMLSNIGMQVLAVALEVPLEYQGLYAQAYGMTTQLGLMLPFSRSHEHEADQIGVYLMYKAGYDPYEAVAFWKRMKAMSGGEKPPEFLSTHPSDDERIKEIGTFITVLEKSEKGNQ
jgi:predicted Zn-dependent protease